jgi:hypothetical protein
MPIIAKIGYGSCGPKDLLKIDLIRGSSSIFSKKIWLQILYCIGDRFSPCGLPEFSGKLFDTLPLSSKMQAVRFLPTVSSMFVKTGPKLKN